MKYDDVGEEFLKQVIRDWADGNIENGMLSKNMSVGEWDRDERQNKGNTEGS